MTSEPTRASSPSPNPAPPTRRSSPFNWRAAAVILLCLAGIIGLLSLDSLVGQHSLSPLTGESLSYGLLFLAGLLTGFHCVGMCGALVVGYTVGAAKSAAPSYRTHWFYVCGKTLSYTAIGALFGAVGAVITFTPFMRGMAGLLAGAFLLIFGLSMLNVFPALNRFRIRPPAMLMRFIGTSARKHGHPFTIGLLNGLMIICGPLQAMYILAAGTGSPIEGARMLFVFGLGTVPLMLGFGMLASALSANVAPKLVKASGIVVMALGVIMLNRGLTMVGSGYDFHSLTARLSHATGWNAEQARPSGYQTIRMQVSAAGFLPSEFKLVKDVPVKWIIEGKELTYCNHRINVPALGMEFDVQKGENVIEFTPRQVGVIPWSCWMGMIPGSFLVYEQAQTAPDDRKQSDWRHRWQERLNRWKDDALQSTSEWLPSNP